MTECDPEESYDDDDEEEDESVGQFPSFLEYLKDGMKFQFLNYQIDNVIFSGNHSTIFKTKGNKPIALKVYDLNDPITSGIISLKSDGELDLPNKMKNLYYNQHPFILPIIEITKCYRSNSIVVALPYAEYGTLENYLADNKTSEKFVINCFYQIPSAIGYLHSNDVSSINLNPRNILVFNEDLINIYNIQKESDELSSLFYIAPEILNNDKSDTKSSDVWSYGLIMYYILYHDLPFSILKSKTKDEIISSITNNELKFPDSTNKSEFITLITKCLHKDPKLRPTFDIILQTKWFPNNTIYNIDESENASNKKYYSFRSFIMESPTPDIFNYHFTREELGSGARSSVWLSINKENGQKYAAKVYSKKVLMKASLEDDELPIMSVQREISILAMLDHPHIIKIEEVIEDDITDSLIIFFKHAKMTLQQYIEHDHNISENEFLLCFYQIGTAIQYMHSLNVVHRDIKPDNILVMDENNFAISDFSISLNLNKEEDRKRVEITLTSPAFLSLEEANGVDDFDPKTADVWAFGITMFYCMYGFFPFNLDKGRSDTLASTIARVTNLLQSEELVIPDKKKYSDCFVDLIKKILEKDPKKRPNINEVLNHKWFESVRNE
ncbi:CAMK family protein kinase [Histomonas meleagridis]|uniref:CAMK family protein kinase n=1 Tax=Histomonas meleagridis TaxID=135588 RepID=UPI00355A9B4F|nr:CAMK family protein kinase [Histomonas meleagridis]KAH0799345.1 CAMK family protein kinase [Histomonas meleagridis]